MASSWDGRGLASRALTAMFHTTWDLITPENIAQALGAPAAFLAVVISLTHMARHWRYNKTKIRKSTVRLLFVVPIFALDCWACLMLEASRYEWAELLTGIREVYEAIALVSFLELVLTISGGTRHLGELMLRRAEEEGPTGGTKHPWPLRLVTARYKAGPELLRMMLLGIFQYVFVCLLYMFLITCVWTMDRLHLLSPQVSLVVKALPNLMKAVSCAFALSCLLLFAHDVKDLVPSCGLAGKFLSIKGIVFFTFWQGFVIRLSQRTGQFGAVQQALTKKALKNGIDAEWWDDAELRCGLNDFLLCFEVLFFSVLHLYAYPAREIERMPEEVQARIRLEERPGIDRIVSTVNLMNLGRLKREILSLADVSPTDSSDGGGGKGSTLVAAAEPLIW
mmetsp:Transcript_93891/g.269121  ORF Transcript_93891/g.269121 Transcript_93891/m.269121 type:complete len:394 (-) Transcript_93891:88-1269(-)